MLFFHGFTHTAQSWAEHIRRIVGNTGFDRLSAYLRSGETPHCRDFVVDGATRTMTQVPAPAAAETTAAAASAHSHHAGPL